MAIALAGAIFGATTSIALGATLWSTMMFVGAIAGACLFAAIVPSMQSQSSATYSFATLQTATSSTAAIPIIYGHCKVAGNKIWQTVSSDGQNINLIIALCWGEIDSVSNIRINDLALYQQTALTIFNTVYPSATVQLTNDYLNLSRAGEVTSFELSDYSVQEMVQWVLDQGDDWVITNVMSDALKATDLLQFPDVDSSEYDIDSWGSHTTTEWLPCGVVPLDISEPGLGDNNWVRVYTGTRGQGVDSMCPDGVNVIGSMNYIAYLALNLRENSRLATSTINVTCEVKGTKVEVYSNGSYVRQYSQNPAWIIRDLMKNDLYGLALEDSEVDEQSFITAAPYYDFVIPTGVPRFTLNYALDTTASAIEYLETMRQGCRSIVYNAQGKYGIIPEKPEDISEYFEAKDFVKGTFKITHASSTDMYETVNVAFVDMDYAWAKNSAQSNMDIDLLDTKPNPGNYSLNCVTSGNQALRLAHFFRLYNYFCPYTIEFKVKRKGISRTIGDVIGVSDLIMEWVKQPFRILSMEEDAQGQTKFTCKIYDADIYTDDLYGDISVPTNTTLPNPMGAIPNITTVNISEDGYMLKNIHVSNLTISWSAVSYKFLERYRVQYCVDGGAWYDFVSTTGTSCVMDNVKVGSSYKIKISVVSIFFKESSGVTTSSYTIVGKDIPPASVVGFYCSEISGGFELYWTANTEIDLAGYNVYRGVKDSSLSNSALITKLYSGTEMFSPISDPGDYVFYIEAVDNSGNTSVVVSTEGILGIPDNVTSLDSTRNGEYVDFAWSAVSGVNVKYEIRKGASWSAGQSICTDIKGTTFRTIFPYTGNTTFWIKAINTYSYYSSDACYSILDIDPTVFRNNIFTTDELAKGWPGTKVNLEIPSLTTALQLEKSTMKGQYLTEINFEKAFSARNWIDYEVIGVTTDPLEWETANFAWNSDKALTSWVPDGDTSRMVVQNQISTFVEPPANIIEAFYMDGSTTGSSSTTPTHSSEIEFEQGSFREGVRIGQTTRLDYPVGIPAEFQIMFFSALTELLTTSVIFAIISSPTGKITIGYDKRRDVFYCLGSDGTSLEGSMSCYATDYLKFAVVQTLTTRKFFASSFVSSSLIDSEVLATPLGAFTKMTLTNAV